MNAKTARDQIAHALDGMEEAIADARRLLDYDGPNKHGDDRLLSLIAAISRRLHNGMNNTMGSIEDAIGTVETMHAIEVHSRAASDNRPGQG